MGEDNRRNFEEIIRDAERQSDKALYPYAKIHIFGPYQDDCFAYLTELRNRLEEFGFKQARICDDRGSEPPDQASDDELREFWWQESQDFLENADASIFVFLDHIFTRDSLPTRAREVAYDSDEEDHKETNSSVSGELMYWLNEIDETNDRTLVIFEEGIFEEMGSVITGLLEAQGIDYVKVNNEKIEAAVSEARQRCMNWVMNELRNELRQRHTQDQIGDT